MTDVSRKGIFEIRDYHYRPERIEEYRAWAHEASKVLATKVDLVGFWVDVGIPSRVMGSDQMDLRHGAPNITWIIRWDDLEQREARWDALWDDEEWSAKWDEHPGEADYFHMSVRFLELA